MTVKTKKVAPIPRGFRSLTPHLATPDVSAAITIYGAAFGASVASVEKAPDTDVILFAQVKIGNSLLTIGQGEAFGAGTLSLHHYVEDLDATWAAALTAGFTELSALEETYWGDRMGLMIDPLGVRWSIAQRVQRLSAEERDERARAALGYPMPEMAAVIEAVTEDATAPTPELAH